MLGSVMLIHISEIFWFILMPLCIGVGALLLWKRTRRIAALLQFIAAVVLVACSVLGVLRSYVDPFHKSWLSKLVWSRYMWEQNAGAMLIAMSVFAISYLCYALSHKGI
jgi:hypothetical protein